MGCSISCHHRLPAVATACLTTVALGLATLSGCSCSFLTITAQNDMLLLAADDAELTVSRATIGVLCERGFYERNGDRMWELSRIFLMVGLILGSLSCALAWALSIFVPPTTTNWKLLSTLASLTAVLQVPIFVLFEAEPCSAFATRQECSMDIGSFLLIASVVFWVTVTLSTQCLDPPLWAIEQAAWRNQKKERLVPTQSDNDIEAGHSSMCNMERYRSMSCMINCIHTHRDDEVPLNPIKNGNSDFRVVLQALPAHNEEDIHTADTTPIEIIPYSGCDNSGFPLLEIPMHTPPRKKSKDIKQEPRYVQPSSPSLAKERITIISHEETYTVPPMTKKDFVPASTILEDLKDVNPEMVEINKEKQLPVTNQKVPTKTNLKQGFRALTDKVRRDKCRRVRKGYAFLDDDVGDDEDVFGGLIPPMEVKVPIVGTGEIDHSKYTEDEAKLITDWQNLHTRPLIGDREMALQNDDVDGIDDIDGDSVKDEEEDSCGSIEDDALHHADPEPVYYSSDDTKSEVDIDDMIDDDNSTLSSGSGSRGSGSRSSGSRGRQSRSRRRRRRRRGQSPMHSVRSSVSLMDLTINEETEKDIKDETTDCEGDETSYPLTRTLSAPEPRGRSLTRHSRSSRRRSLSGSSPRGRSRKLRSFDNDEGDDEGVRVSLLSSTDMKHDQEQWTAADISSSVCEEDGANAEGMAEENLDVMENQQPKIYSDVLPTVDYITSQSTPLSPTENMDDAESISPDPYIESDELGESKSACSVDLDPLNVPSMTERSTGVIGWKQERAYAGGIHARTAVVSDDSDSGCDRSAKSNTSARARRARIQRLRSKTRRFRVRDPETRDENLEAAGVYNSSDEEEGDSTGLNPLPDGSRLTRPSIGHALSSNDYPADNPALHGFRKKSISPLGTSSSSEESPELSEPSTNILSKLQIQTVGSEVSELGMASALLRPWSQEDMPTHYFQPTDRPATGNLHQQYDSSRVPSSDISSSESDYVLEAIDLQLIGARRRVGEEYGSDEGSL